jgi:hypothetical protein
MIYRAIKKRITGLTIALCLLGGHSANAQSTPQLIMDSLYRSYDSIKYLTFDVRFTYSSDTLLGDFTHDVLEGTFTMAGKKSKYNLGDVEFIQNDSFLIAVYNTDKYIIVANPHTKNTGTELPMRQAIDSLIFAYAQYYTITVSTVDSVTGKINFARADSLAQFDNFSISYYSDQHLLKSIDYSFQELPVLDSTIIFSSAPYPRQKRLKIEFSKYRGDNFSDTIYSENNYIFFEDGMYKPIAKYKDYQVFNSRTGLIAEEQIQQ